MAPSSSQARSVKKDAATQTKSIPKQAVKANSTTHTAVEKEYIMPQITTSVYEEFIHQIEEFVRHDENDSSGADKFEIFVENWYTDESYRLNRANDWTHLAKDEWPAIALHESLENQLELWYFWSGKEKYSNLREFISHVSRLTRYYAFGQRDDFDEFFQYISKSEESLDQLYNALLKYRDGCILEPVNIFEKIVLHFIFSLIERDCDINQVINTIHMCEDEFECSLLNIWKEIPLYKSQVPSNRAHLRTILHVLRDTYPCESCGKDATKFCSRCSNVRYCSKECKKLDRSRHLETCPSLNL